MKPITDSFEKLKEEFKKSIITYEYYKIDPDDAENVHLKNMTDLNLIWEGFMFHLNGHSINGVHFIDLVKQTKEEVLSNLRMPIDTQDQLAYLEKVVEFSSNFEESIISKDGRWFHVDENYEGFLYDELPSMDKEFLSDSLKELKTSFRNLIAFVQFHSNSLKSSEQRTNKNMKTSVQIPQLEYNQLLSPNIITKSFHWNRKESFKRDMLMMFELLTRSDIIPKETDFNAFCYAFSGKPLLEPLRIKWLIPGKNKQTSKSSLFHFISRLEDSKLIESKEWSEKSNMPLYQKISVIFTDKDDNMFPIDGLKSSKSQGLGKDCARQSEIDRIVKTIALLNTAKISE